MRIKMKNCILLLLYSLPYSAHSITKATLSDVHICCVTCQEAIEKAVRGIQGVNVEVDRDKQSVTISASDDTMVHSALDAIANAGFYGKSDSNTLSMKIEPMEGKLSTTDFTGFHNCCVSCSASLEAAVKKVPSVESDAINKRSCVVKGNFNVAYILEKMNKAGFSTAVKY